MSDLIRLGDIGGDAGFIQSYRERVTGILAKVGESSAYGDVSKTEYYNRILVGYLYRSLYEWMTVLEETGLFGNDGSVQFSSDDLNRHVILPTLLAHSSFPTRNHMFYAVDWCKEVCIALLIADGWTVNVSDLSNNVTLVGNTQTFALGWNTGDMVPVVTLTVSKKRGIEGE